MFKAITGLFFVANFHSSTNLETKISTYFTTYKVASLQRFFHWRSQKTFGIAFKNPRSVFKTADYWLPIAGARKARLLFFNIFFYLFF